MSWQAQELVAYLNWADLALDFWARHSEKLTLGEAERIAHGDYGALIRPLEPSWPTGEWLGVASNLWIKPEEPMWRRDGYRIHFDVRDFRARLPRRVPQVFDPPTLDKLGRPLPPSRAAVAAARLDGSYTAAHELAVPDTDDEVEDKFLDLFSAEAGAKRVLGDSDATKARLDEIKRLSPSRRLMELQKLASERGLDVRDEVRAFERRLKRRIEKAA